MRAAWYDRTGPADEVLTVGNLPRPEAGPGELLVRLHASAVNPADFKRRSGWLPFPPGVARIIPHSDGAGIVEAVGAELDPAWRGRRVWVTNAAGAVTYDGTPTEIGTAADFVAIPVDRVVPLPEPISFAVGACLGIPGCTAYRAVFADGPIDGQTVLVQGGAGAVGELAVQFAAAAGARVIAVVSSPAKAAVARAAGADSTVDRRRDGLVDAIRSEAPRGVDRIIEVDFGANAAVDAAVVKQDGIIASYSSTSAPIPSVPYYPLQHRGVLIRLITSYHVPATARRRAEADITIMLLTGALKPTIAATLPLGRIADAHRLKESGTAIGNVIVTSDPAAV